MMAIGVMAADADRIKINVIATTPHFELQTWGSSPSFVAWAGRLVQMRGDELLEQIEGGLVLAYPPGRKPLLLLWIGDAVEPDRFLDRALCVRRLYGSNLRSRRPSEMRLMRQRGSSERGGRLDMAGI